MSTESKQQELVVRPIYTFEFFFTPAVLKASDISDELKEDIFKISVDALNTCDLEREIAASIKHQLDSKYGNTWHVIVGKNFGSYVTHEKGNFIYFYIGPLAFLIFKTL